ncbi:hypothetical protein BH11PLA1_BH11PLA1_03340 [soil metagenome]
MATTYQTKSNSAKSSLVTGIFRTSEEAARGIDALIAGGVDRGDINVVASEQTNVEAFGIEKHSKAGKGAAIGGATGAAVVALIAGFTVVGALATGGLGIIAAGPIVAALAGAGAGAAAGGVIGGLIGLGIPEHEVKFYKDALEKGSVLVGVHCAGDRTSFVSSTLKQHGAESPGTA